jgi:small-conductance mechanosensitive channel
MAPAPVDLAGLLGRVPIRAWVAAGLVVGGVVAGLVAGRLVRRGLAGSRVPTTVEGTAFERTARDFGTSTVAIVGTLVTYLVVGVAIFAALSALRVEYADRFWNEVASFLPRLFAAAVVLLAGLLVGDKAELALEERLRSVKLPRAGGLPTLAKYSVFYVAALIALGQLGVAVLSLVVLLAAYLFAVVVLVAVACRPLLRSAAAGTYILLREPYGIGDEISVDGHRGVVQEMDLLVTHVEADDEEYIVPNAAVFAEGVVRIRS